MDLSREVRLGRVRDADFTLPDHEHLGGLFVAHGGKATPGRGPRGAAIVRGPVLVVRSFWGIIRGMYGMARVVPEPRRPAIRRDLCGARLSGSLRHVRRLFRAGRAPPTRRGAVNVALALARQGLSPGLATCSAMTSSAAAPREDRRNPVVDVGGVALAPARAGFVLVDASAEPARSPPSPRKRRRSKCRTDVVAGPRPLGLSRWVSHAAALCKPRVPQSETGALVVIDFQRELHVWAGRDPRTIGWCSRSQMWALQLRRFSRCSGMDVAMCAHLCSRVPCSGERWKCGAVATGPSAKRAFVREVLAPRPARRRRCLHAALCAELMCPGEPGRVRAPSGIEPSGGARRGRLWPARRLTGDARPRFSAPARSDRQVANERASPGRSRDGRCPRTARRWRRTSARQRPPSARARSVSRVASAPLGEAASARVALPSEPELSEELVLHGVLVDSGGLA